MKTLLEELAGTECACGKKKVEFRSFCYSCWKKLPGDVQSRLFNRMGDGYEDAHAAAIKILGIKQ